MSGPKITVIGAGSFFFGRPIIHKMATSPVMAGGTLALVDIDPHVVKTMSALARRVFKHTGCGVKVLGDTDRRKIMADSDFVILSFSYRNAHYRDVDTRIAAKHGMLMCSSDTIGPGGIFRALRETPIVLDIARDAQRLAPNAWLINFVNPTTVLGMALQRFAPRMRSFALCDGNHEPYNTLNYCKRAGILPMEAASVPPDVWSKLDLAIGGVNHFTWVTRFNYDGRDMLPRLRQWLVERAAEEKKNPSEYSKDRYNAHYALELMDLFGAYPTAISHTKEYVPYYQGFGIQPCRPEPIRTFDGAARQRLMDRAWKETEQFAAGELSPRQFLKQTHDDHATDIVENMWGGLGKAFFINSPNRGAVCNLPDDALLELRCDVDMHGPRPQSFGAMPRGLLGLTQRLLDVHELTAQAAATGDRAALRQAMAIDPLCCNLVDADACIKELLEAQREVLPSYWFKGKSVRGAGRR